MQLGNKKKIHILLLEVTVFNCSCLIEGCRGLIVKQPLHDNFFFLANMSWPTPKNLANSCVHTSNTRQIATYANSQHGVRGAMAHTESCRFRLAFILCFSSKKQQKAMEKQKGLGKTTHSKKSFPWRVQYARARASRRG